MSVSKHTAGALGSLFCLGFVEIVLGESGWLHSSICRQITAVARGFRDECMAYQSGAPHNKAAVDLTFGPVAKSKRRPASFGIFAMACQPGGSLSRPDPMACLHLDAFVGRSSAYWPGSVESPNDISTSDYTGVSLCLSRRASGSSMPGESWYCLDEASYRESESNFVGGAQRIPCPCRLAIRPLASHPVMRLIPPVRTRNPDNVLLPLYVPE